ncbi:MAG: nucleotide exchange factor GrpE [Phototrophicales bacterium]|nr:MAG: nucleotide exchange factor GrpE [Phototrophicales bacterium]RMG77953.1 MAG: nucleotide exchange factor GrpE [Chloroflexota bacterium]
MDTQHDEHHTAADTNQLEQERDEWKDKYLRAKAEFDNARKRLETRYASQALQEKKRFLLDMLPVVDNLQRALQHANSDTDALRSGVEMTLKIFIEKLESHGVHTIDALGKPFDPNLHEAVGYLDSTDYAPGYVAQVEQSGYTLDEELLRPARVLVVANPIDK